MELIKIINGLGDNQYLEATNDPSNPLRCVDKPEFICLFTQALEFAKVLEVAQKTFKGQAGEEVDFAKQKLYNRYKSFIQNHSSFALLLTFLFLWAMGYKDESSLESMSTKMEVLSKTFYTDEIIANSITKYPSLKEIILGKDVTNRGVGVIATRYDELESITFFGFDKISSNTCKLLVETRPIKTVKLMNCNDEIAQVFLEYCPQLTELSFTNCQITDETLKRAAKTDSLLKKVTIVSCGNITYDGSKKLIEKCSKIVEFDLICTQIPRSQQAELENLVKNRTAHT